MKKINRSFLDNEIDLVEIWRQLWNKKFLILFISLVFMFAGYVYGSLKPKIYKTEITLRVATSPFFELYRPFLDLEFQLQQQQQQQQQQHKKDIAELFNREFELNLLSLDTLVQFVQQNNEIDEFKFYLKENNIDVREYFKGRFKSETNQSKNISNRYSLTFQKPLSGEQFLNSYIIFVKQQTTETFKQQLSKIITNEINTYQQNVKIAEKINLENPILKSTVEDNPKDRASLFYKGTKVLSQQLVYLNHILNQTKEIKLDYNPILEKASFPSLVSKSSTIFTGIGFILGLLFSFIVIFLRHVLQNKVS